MPGPPGSRRSMRSYTGRTSSHDQPSAPSSAHVSKSEGAPRTQTIALRRARPAEDAAARPREPASVGVLLRHRLVGPVDLGEPELVHPPGIVDRRVLVLPAGLEQQDAPRARVDQAPSDDGAGRTGTDDDDVGMAIAHVNADYGDGVRPPSQCSFYIMSWYEIWRCVGLSPGTACARCGRAACSQAGCVEAPAEWSLSRLRSESAQVPARSPSAISIVGFTEAFTGHRDYSAAGHASYGGVHGIGFWFVVAAPVLGGLIYGPLIHGFAREARGHGVPEVMLAVAERGGRIRPQVAVVKSLASALCIGSGGSVGREGPIVQIGSALGSTLGQLARVPESRLRILVACGAAGGISATFNAPIAGVFFALELILRDFEAESFGVVVLASFVADVIGRAAFGNHPFLPLPGFQLRSPVEYPLYIGLGLAAAVIGRRLHPRPLRRRGPRRPSLGGMAGMASPCGRRPAARAPAPCPA